MAIQDNETRDRNPNLIENLMGYIDTRIDIIKLEIQEKLKAAFVSTLHFALLGIIAFMCFIFLNLFLGLLLNELLDSSFWGFGIVALLYIIILVILLVGLDKKAFQSIADKSFDNTIYKSDKREPHV
ncbi:phage holin family protein [Pontibacter toksunensis]|uniref:Phage holin family protein n=1 Tax=Pontibacter toksunensis TaxID=1332631 RepID=A0ABW6BRA1_9BACT